MNKGRRRTLRFAALHTLLLLYATSCRPAAPTATCVRLHLFDAILVPYAVLIKEGRTGEPLALVLVRAHRGGWSLAGGPCGGRLVVGGTETHVEDSLSFSVIVGDSNDDASLALLDGRPIDLDGQSIWIQEREGGFTRLQCDLTEFTTDVLTYDGPVTETQAALRQTIEEAVFGMWGEVGFWGVGWGERWESLERFRLDVSR